MVVDALHDLPPGVELVQVRLVRHERVGARMEEIAAIGVGDVVVQWFGSVWGVPVESSSDGAGMGRERGQNAADGAQAVVEGLGIVGEDGPAGGDLVALAGDLRAVAVAESGLVRYLARVFRNEGTLGRVPAAVRPGSGLEAAVFEQPAEWPRRRPGRRSGAGRAGSGTARRPVWGTSGQR